MLGTMLRGRAWDVVHLVCGCRTLCKVTCYQQGVVCGLQQFLATQFIDVCFLPPPDPQNQKKVTVSCMVVLMVCGGDTTVMGPLKRI